MQIPEWLQKKREAAKQAFETLEMPNFKYGLTIRLDARGLELTPDQDSEQIVTLEHENCEAYNMFEHLDNELLKRHLLTTTPEQENKITKFTEAFFDMGLIVIVKENQKARINLQRTITSQTFKEHILVLAEKNSQLTFTDRYQSNDCNLKTTTVEIIAKENANVTFAGVQNLNDTCFDFTSHRASLEKNANVQWFIASLGSKFSKASTDTHLQGEGAQSKSYGVFLGTKKQQFDISAASYHKGNKSTSDMYTRGVLDQQAKAVYRGLIDIDEQAFGCDGYQKEETILVSQHAVADAIPNLEIRNNEVKCSHGATIGRVDEEQLFYLTSRGIEKQDAIRMIAEGFFEPITAKIDESLYEKILPIVQEKLQHA